MTETIHRVFTSFEYEDLHYTSLMGAWSANENDDFDIYEERLKVRVDSTDSDYIKRVLRAKIDRASVLVCMIGPTTAGSAWVNWEIEYAKSKGKGLVGVETTQRVVHPTKISNAGAIFVPYEKDAISRAIDWAATAGKTSQDWRFK